MAYLSLNGRNVEVVIGNREGKVIHARTPVKRLNQELKEFIYWYNKNLNFLYYCC